MNETDTPKGTWSSQEMPAVQATAGVVALHPASDSSARAGGDSQVTPLPTSPLALASDAPLLRADATGSRPKPPKESADVVPIRAAVATDSDKNDSDRDGSSASKVAVSETDEQTHARAGVSERPPSDAVMEPEPPADPPFLASRSLAEDLEPLEPARKTSQRLVVILGVLGAAGVVLLGGTDTSSLAAASGLVALALIALLPLRYEIRALAISGLAATGLGFFSAGLSLRGERLDESLLAGAVFVLGAGLLFRSYHRASRMARLVVILGILSLGSYLFLSGGLGTLTHLDGAWQSWAPVVPRIMLALLGLTAVLAFMDASSTAGGAILATVLFIVNAAHVFVREAVRLFPRSDLGQHLAIPDAHLGQSMAVVVVVIAGSLALAQLLAVSAAKRRRARG